MKRVVVLGGGVGGTRVANLLRRRRGDIAITVVDSHGDHLYQPALLYLPFGIEYEFARDERSLLHPEIELRVERVVRVDAEWRIVHLEGGSRLTCEALVIATGSRLDHGAIPGLKEGTHNFHCRRSAERLREALAGFTGGAIVVGAARLPYKCPYAPFEFALLLADWLERRGLRSATTIQLVYPVSPAAGLGSVADRVGEMLRERGVEVLSPFRIASVDPSAEVIRSEGGEELPYDLAVVVPPHVGAPFLRDSGMAGPGNWVPADRETLRVRKGVYVLGDAADLPLPKLGAVAHFQSEVVAENVLADLDGAPPSARYDGLVRHFFETGGGRALDIEYAYERPARPTAPSLLANQKKNALHRFYFKLVPRALIK